MSAEEAVRPERIRVEIVMVPAVKVLHQCITGTNPTVAIIPDPSLVKALAEGKEIPFKCQCGTEMMLYVSRIVKADAPKVLVPK